MTQLLGRLLSLKEVAMVIEIGKRSVYKVRAPKVRRIPRQADTKHYNRMLKRMRKSLPYLNGR